MTLGRGERFEFEELVRGIPWPRKYFPRSHIVNVTNGTVPIVT